MLRKRRGTFLLAAVAGSIAFHAQVGLAAPMSTSEMVIVLREAKVVAPSTRIDIVQNDGEVTVITKRSAKMTDDDCKIKAVLMAKALMDARPKELAAVKVIYTVDGENQMSKVRVGAGEVQSFALGAITEKQLLGSLELTKESESTTDTSSVKDVDVVDGAQKERRAVLQARIDALKEGGTGVAPFQRIFGDIEVLTKAGRNREAAQLISDLSARLTEQENLRDQAKRVGEGQGVNRLQLGSGSAYNRQGWGKGQNNNGALQSFGSGNETQNRINRLRNRIKFLDQRDIPTGAFAARLNYAEQQISKLSRQALNTMIDGIKTDMDKASQAKLTGTFLNRPNGR